MILHYNCLNHYRKYYNDLEWVEIYSSDKNFNSITIPKEYHQIWISFRIQYIPNHVGEYIARDIQIGAGAGIANPNCIYTDSYYFDENNRVTWGIVYNPVNRILSVPDNWIAAYYHSTKFTPSKSIMVWCRKMK